MLSEYCWKGSKAKAKPVLKISHAEDGCIKPKGPYIVAYECAHIQFHIRHLVYYISCIPPKLCGCVYLSNLCSHWDIYTTPCWICLFLFYFYFSVILSYSDKHCSSLFSLIVKDISLSIHHFCLLSSHFFPWLSVTYVCPFSFLWKLKNIVFGSMNVFKCLSHIWPCGIFWIDHFCWYHMILFVSLQRWTCVLQVLVPPLHLWLLIFNICRQILHSSKRNYLVNRIFIFQLSGAP